MEQSTAKQQLVDDSLLSELSDAVQTLCGYIEMIAVLMESGNEEKDPMTTKRSSRSMRRHCEKNKINKKVVISYSVSRYELELEWR
jgi:hypothetical protein